MHNYTAAQIVKKYKTQILAQLSLRSTGAKRERERAIQNLISEWNCDACLSNAPFFGTRLFIGIFISAECSGSDFDINASTLMEKINVNNVDPGSRPNWLV